MVYLQPAANPRSLKHLYLTPKPSRVIHAYSHRELAERYVDLADGPVNLYEDGIPSVNDLQLQILWSILKIHA